jgi:flagellar biosynthesis chaperone FliJ
MCESVVMPFVYRLQKILDFRIRKKEEQLLVVQNAQRELSIAEQNILQNNAEIELTKQNQKQAAALMMESYDKYLHHLWEKGKKLEEIRQEKERQLQEEIQKLIELEKAVKVLEKHKEHNKEEYLEEEKKAELKTFSEIAIQRHFQHTQQKIEDAQKEQLQLNQAEIELMEGNNL